MPRDSDRPDHLRPVGRLVFGLVVVALIALFGLWRLDGPRVERLRTAITDAIVPKMDWAMAPLTAAVDMAGSFRSYAQLYDHNRELRRELQQMRAWKEAALQLEQENARLLDLNNVKLDATTTFVTGKVLADAGSPFRQSVLLNIGARDGIRDGWAAMDGIGLVGRISGVGRQTSRVVLLTDPASAVPVTIQPSGQRALLTGDNGPTPLLKFLDSAEMVSPGDRLVSSGDGGVFPAGLLVGRVARGADNRLHARLAADYGRLEYLRVLRHSPPPEIERTGQLVMPMQLLQDATPQAEAREE